MPLAYTIHDQERKNPESQLYSTLSVKENEMGKIAVMGLEYNTGKYDLIEQDFNPMLTTQIIQDYLNSQQLSNIKHLILGCTHYPLIKKHIDDFYKNKVSIIDSPSIMGSFVENLLQEKQLCNQDNRKAKKIHIKLCSHRHLFL